MLSGLIYRKDEFGRLKCVDVADIPVSGFNGGSPGSALGELVFSKTAPIAGYVGGLPYCAGGALAVDDAGSPDHYVNGIPIAATGRVFALFGGPVSHFAHSLPFDVSGALMLATPSTPVNLHAFDSAFDQQEFF
jgi:hypothetical protein